MSDFLKKNLNVPNILSLIRLCMVPVYIIVFAQGNKNGALAIFVAASATDMLDGLIARKFHLITDLGTVLDPLADKLMVLTAMFSMAIGNSKIPAVLPLPAVLIVLGKELILVTGGIKLYHQKVILPARIWGKAAQVAFFLGLLASYFHGWFAQHCSSWLMTPDLILIWCAVGMSLLALLGYAYIAFPKLKK